METKPRNYFKFFGSLYNDFMPEGSLLVSPDIVEKESDEIVEYVLGIAKNVLMVKSMFIGDEALRKLERDTLIEVIDTYWVDHIDLMDQMRQSIGFVSVAQKDPVKEYTVEGYKMFEELYRKIKVETLKFVFANPDEEQ